MTRDELEVQYPLDADVHGWRFRIREVSAGCYLVEGRDLHGREVSRQTSDPEATLAECIAYAQQLSAAMPNI